MFWDMNEVVVLWREMVNSTFSGGGGVGLCIEPY